MAILNACTSQKYTNNFTLKGNQLVVKKTEFTSIKKEKKSQLKFILIKPENLAFPIAIYKEGETNYKALLLQCTHQGCELNPHETTLVCPCHGAEFNTSGQVTQGPAEIDLKSFITSHDTEHIYIQLS